jgi:NADPH:quinone reductase-like Zn-dependent oxidoreductase
MRAIVIKQIVRDCGDKKQLEEGLKVEHVRRPVPSYNQVLIRVQRAQINPSDLAFIKGHYGKRGHTGEIPGFECAGTVVDNGASPFAWLLKGKRVATYTKSCWAEYVVVDANNCLVLNDAYSWESAAGAMINPLTVMLMLDTCAHEKVVVVTAGTSDLSKRFTRAANTKGIKTIAIVSTESHVEACKKAGAVAVLNSESEEFEAHLTQLCHDNHVRMAFDLVGGQVGSSVLSSLINGGEIYELGMLSGEPIQPSLGDLVLEQKCVKGLFVNSVFDMNMFKLLKMKNDVAAMLDTELKGEVQATFEMEEIADAVCSYMDDQAAGKVQLIIGDAEKVERVPSKQQEHVDEEKRQKEQERLRIEREVEEAYRQQQEAQRLYERQKQQLDETSEEYQQMQQQQRKDDIIIGGQRVESEDAYQKQLENPTELHRQQRKSQIDQHKQLEGEQDKLKKEQQQVEQQFKKQQEQQFKQQEQQIKQHQHQQEQQLNQTQQQFKQQQQREQQVLQQKQQEYEQLQQSHEQQLKQQQQQVKQNQQREQQKLQEKQGQFEQQLHSKQQQLEQQQLQSKQQEYSQQQHQSKQPPQEVYEREKQHEQEKLYEQQQKQYGQHKQFEQQQQQQQNEQMSATQRKQYEQQEQMLSANPRKEYEQQQQYEQTSANQRWEQQTSSQMGEKQQEQQSSGVGGRGGVQDERYTKSSLEHREQQQGQQ